MKPKDIFGLAVRLLGLVFLFLGLNDVMQAVKQITDLSVADSLDREDVLDGIINGPLPVVFNLLVAWWLLCGRLLIRWAYPESPKIPEPARQPIIRTAPAAEALAPAPSGVEGAEEKLAALVEKPRDNPGA